LNELATSELEITSFNAALNIAGPLYDIVNTGGSKTATITGLLFNKMFFERF
jgi:hypothetical protein